MQDPITLEKLGLLIDAFIALGGSINTAFDTRQAPDSAKLGGKTFQEVVDAASAGADLTDYLKKDGDASNVQVTFDSATVTLAAALSDISGDLADFIATKATGEDVIAGTDNAKYVTSLAVKSGLEKVVADLRGGVDGTYDTLKKLADALVSTNDDVAALELLLADKLDKTGTAANSSKLEGQTLAEVKTKFITDSPTVGALLGTDVDAIVALGIGRYIVAVPEAWANAPAGATGPGLLVTSIYPTKVGATVSTAISREYHANSTVVSGAVQNTRLYYQAGLVSGATKGFSAWRRDGDLNSFDNFATAPLNVLVIGDAAAMAALPKGRYSGPADVTLIDNWNGVSVDFGNDVTVGYMMASVYDSVYNGVPVTAVSRRITISTSKGGSPLVYEQCFYHNGTTTFQKDWWQAASQGSVDYIDGRLNDLETTLDEITGGTTSSIKDVQDALNAFIANKASGAEAIAGTDDVKYITALALKAKVDDAISQLVDGAPTALDTLKELADRLTEEGDAVAALTLALDGKLGKTEQAADSLKLAGKTLTEVKTQYVDASGTPLNVLLGTDFAAISDLPHGVYNIETPTTWASSPEAGKAGQLITTIYTGNTAADPWVIIERRWTGAGTASNGQPAPDYRQTTSVAGRDVYSGIWTAIPGYVDFTNANYLPLAGTDAQAIATMPNGSYTGTIATPANIGLTGSVGSGVMTVETFDASVGGRPSRCATRVFSEAQGRDTLVRRWIQSISYSAGRPNLGPWVRVQPGELDLSLAAFSQLIVDSYTAMVVSFADGVYSGPVNPAGYAAASPNADDQGHLRAEVSTITLGGVSTQMIYRELRVARAGSGKVDIYTNAFQANGTAIIYQTGWTRSSPDDSAHGLYHAIDMLAAPNAQWATALPNALYNMGMIVGRAKGSDLGLSGPVAINNRTGLLKIYGSLTAAGVSVGVSPFNSIRREFSGFGGAMFAQYAIDANTWSSWVQLPTIDTIGKLTSGLYVGGSNVALDSPAAAYAIVQAATGQTASVRTEILTVESVRDTGPDGVVIPALFAAIYGPQTVLMRTIVSTASSGTHGQGGDTIEQLITWQGRTWQRAARTVDTSWTDGWIDSSNGLATQNDLTSSIFQMADAVEETTDTINGIKRWKPMLTARSLSANVTGYAATGGNGSSIDDNTIIDGATITELSWDGVAKTAKITVPAGSFPNTPLTLYLRKDDGTRDYRSSGVSRSGNDIIFTFSDSGFLAGLFVGNDDQVRAVLRFS